MYNKHTYSCGQNNSTSLKFLLNPKTQKLIKNSIKLFGQSTQAVVPLYWVYWCRIIQQRMLVIDNFHEKIRYIFTHFFHIFFKSSIAFVLSKWLNTKKKKIHLYDTSYMLYWIHLVLCCIVYFALCFLTFKQFDSTKPTQLLQNIWKHTHIFFIHTFW